MTTHTRTHIQHTLITTKPCTTLRECYLYQPLIHLPTLPWPGSLHRVWEMRTARRESVSETVTAHPWWCVLLDRHAVGGREKKMEESVKGSNQWVVSDGTFPISSFSLYWLSWTQSLKRGKEETGEEEKIVSFQIQSHHILHAFTSSVLCFSSECYITSGSLNFPSFITFFSHLGLLNAVFCTSVFPRVLDVSTPVWLCNHYHCSIFFEPCKDSFF